MVMLILEQSASSKKVLLDFDLFMIIRDSPVTMKMRFDKKKINMNLGRLLAHEIGHALGAEHDDGENNKHKSVYFRLCRVPGWRGADEQYSVQQVRHRWKYIVDTFQGKHLVKLQLK